MKQMQQPFKSNLHPMIHVFKNSSGRIVRQILCYNTKGVAVAGRANHKYNPVTCGWNMPMTFVYVGPLFACRRCHRHIWSKESYRICPQCGGKLNALSVSASPGIPADRELPTGGSLNLSAFQS